MAQKAQVVLGPPYLPSTVTFQDMRNVSIRDLRPNTHHRGRVVWLSKILGHTAVEPAFIALGVSNGSTDPCTLQILLADPILANDDVLARNRVALAVKEPFCSHIVEERAVIRVDHLSDMVVTFLPDVRAPDSFNSRALDTRLHKASGLKVGGQYAAEGGQDVRGDDEV